MEVKLKVKYKVEGLAALGGIHFSRISLRATRPCTNWHSDTVDRIKAKHGELYNQWRLIREVEGYIWREVLGDTGIGGHYKTLRAAYISAAGHKFQFFVDEPFWYEDDPQFIKLEAQHKARLKCMHLGRNDRIDTFYRDDKRKDPFRMKYCEGCARWVEFE